MSTHRHSPSFLRSLATLTTSVPGPLLLSWALATTLQLLTLRFLLDPGRPQVVTYFLLALLAIWVLEAFKDSLYRPLAELATSASPRRPGFSQIFSRTIPLLPALMGTQALITMMVVLASVLMSIFGVSISLIPLTYLSLAIGPALFVAATTGRGGIPAIQGALELTYRHWKLVLVIPTIFVCLAPLFDPPLQSLSSLFCTDAGSLHRIRALIQFSIFAYLQWLFTAAAYITAARRQEAD